MQNSDYLGKEKVGKLLVKFAIPCILSLIISCLYNIVDQIFVGAQEKEILIKVCPSIQN